MKPGYYWAKRVDYAWPTEVVLIRDDKAWAAGVDHPFPIKGFAFLGPCKPPGVKVARIQARRTRPERFPTTSWRVYVPAAKSRHHFSIDTEGQAVEWIVRAETYDVAREVFRRTFDLTRIPIGTTFTRIEP